MDRGNLGGVDWGNLVGAIAKGNNFRHILNVSWGRDIFALRGGGERIMDRQDYRLVRTTIST